MKSNSIINRQKTYLKHGIPLKRGIVMCWGVKKIVVNPLERGLAAQTRTSNRQAEGKALVT